MTGRRFKRGSMLQTTQATIIQLLTKKSRGLVNGYLTVKSTDFGGKIEGCYGFKEKAGLRTFHHETN